MPRQQRNYTQEFRQEAVRLVETSGKPMTQIARDLGVSDSAFSAWAKHAKALVAMLFLAADIRHHLKKKIAD